MQKLLSIKESLISQTKTKAPPALLNTGKAIFLKIAGARPFTIRMEFDR